jgi:hypothetical protein
MTSTSAAKEQTVPSRSNRVIYLGVIVVEALVLLGIWLVQRHFGS